MTIRDTAARDTAAEADFRYQVVDHDPAVVRRLAESTGFFTPAEVDVAEELVLERLAKGDASGYHFIFAELDGQTVGYACYGPIACTIGSFDLYWIVVDAQHQRRGWGHLLLREAERQINAQGGRKIYIETSSRAQYAPTRAFYQRAGYEVAAVIDDFYAEGDSKVLLAKTLTRRDPARGLDCP